ncbi:MAG: cysteine hydrolase [Deltaproteobacteria bacterium]|nr:MAG: cysteine hydrolase [Deltaproteobacteria bacterium]RLC15302.1 MAG: cysteine hydrolase [Deltaproteobacteria bacterium]
MNIEKSKSAIVLIEFQNQWTTKGLYHWLIKGQLTSRNVLANTITLVDEARKKGVKIIHAPLIIDPENKKGWLAWLTFGKVFTKGTRKSEIMEELFKEGDILVTGRYAFDAFVGSDLEQIIEDNDIETLLVCGFTTDQCVAKTMRTAIKKGIDSYLVSDCTATMNGFFQWKTERKHHDRVVNHLKTIDLLSHT